MLSRFALFASLWNIAYAQESTPSNAFFLEKVTIEVNVPLQSDLYQFILDSSDFILESYDAHHRLLTVSWPNFLTPRNKKGQPIHFDAPHSHLLLWIDPDNLRAAQEAWRDGSLKLILKTKSQKAASHQEEASTGEWHEPISAQLMQGDLQLSENAEESPQPMIMQIGPIRQLPLKKEALIDQINQIGKHCVLPIVRSTHVFQGAVQIELRVNPLGIPERPQIAIDGLVYPALTRCLLEELSIHLNQWKLTNTDQIYYLPFYFYPAAPEQP